MTIDVDDIFRIDDPPPAMAPTSAAPNPTPAPPAPDYSTERSRLFLSDPEAFFQGWRRVGNAWIAPWANR